MTTYLEMSEHLSQHGLMYHGHWAIEHTYADGRSLRVFRPVSIQGPVETPTTERVLFILLAKGQSGDVSPEEAAEIARIRDLQLAGEAADD